METKDNSNIDSNKSISLFKVALQKNKDSFAIPIILFIFLLFVLLLLFTDKLNPTICFIIIAILVGFCILLYYKLLLKEYQKQNFEEREKYFKKYVRDSVFEKQISKRKSKNNL